MANDSEARGKQASAIPHAVVEAEGRLVVHGDDVVGRIPQLGVLIVQGKEVVTQRRDTWGEGHIRDCEETHCTVTCLKA